MEWTDEIITRLRQLWDEGLSTAEIGRRLGISKNSVVGKAHRLDLPARPSPIRRDPSAEAAPRVAPRRLSGPTLPSFATPAPVETAAVAAEPSRSVAPRVVAERAVPERSSPSRLSPVRPMLVAATRPTPRIPVCCWPIGEPGTPSFRFCSEPAMAGKPYCQPHAEIAYVRVRDRREDVA